MRQILPIMTMFILFSCGEKKDIPDVSAISADFEIFRTEKMIFSTSSKDSLVNILEVMQKNHPSFFDVYFNHVFPVGPAKNTDSLAMAILAFKQQPLSDTLLAKVDKHYRDFSRTEQAFKKAFQFAKYYFPDFASPDVYTLLSEYGLQGFIFEGRGGKDALGVGLDMFLSQSFDYKRLEPDNPGFSSYITRSWNQDHLVKKTLDVWLSDFVEPVNGNKLIDQMISNGKKTYILSKILPEVHDSVIFEYSMEATKWCADNELQMWSFFNEKNLLNDTNPIQIGKYINPSPDSPGMPREAPGRTGNYIGYKIVKAYMDKNETVTLEALAGEKDGDKIYTLSKYKPKRR
jgi:hypothetical protein